jgi:glycosyltransferase involved in cell wall biosynthesis
MKILVIIPSLKRGGAERVASRLTTVWAASHDVLLLLYDEQGPRYPYGGHRLCLDRAARPGLWRKAIRVASRALRIAQVIRRFQPDRVISFMEAANIPAILSAAIVGFRKKLIVSVHNDPSRFPRFYQWAIRLLYPFAHATVAVSEGISSELRRNFGLAKSRVVPIPNPIDVAGAREAVQQEQRGDYILAVGRLNRQKGFDLLLRAYAKMRERIRRPLVILGDGPERSSLLALAEALHVAGDVQLRGSVENPFAIMAAADLMVVSSRYEGWGVALAEAMACGCPAVSFACNYGPSEIIEDGKSGLLVTPENVEELAGRMGDVLENRDLHDRLAAGATERVQRFDAAVVAPLWLET